MTGNIAFFSRMSNLRFHSFLVVLFLVPCLIHFTDSSGLGPMMAHAQEDTASEEFEESDGVVEDEEAVVDGGGDQVVSTGQKGEEEEEEEEGVVELKASPDAITSILFVTPPGQSDIPAGREAAVLIGFSNEGEKQFVVQTLEASIRYPQDFSYHIQNFSTYQIEQPVDAGKEATFEYLFTPSESLSSRPFGLVISINYRDEDKVLYTDAVFNATVMINEPDEGVDGEIVFLYVFLFAVIILIIIGVTQLVSSIKKKHMGSKAKQPIEMGTQNKADVDYDWLPEETLQELKKSPKPSPLTRTSPRQRIKKRVENHE